MKIEDKELSEEYKQLLEKVHDGVEGMRTKKIKLRLKAEQMEYLTVVKNRKNHKSYSETVNMMINDFLKLLIECKNSLYKL